MFLILTIRQEILSKEGKIADEKRDPKHGKSIDRDYYVVRPIPPPFLISNYRKPSRLPVLFTLRSKRPPPITSKPYTVELPLISLAALQQHAIHQMIPFANYKHSPNSHQNPYIKNIPFHLAPISPPTQVHEPQPIRNVEYERDEKRTQKYVPIILPTERPENEAVRHNNGPPHYRVPTRINVENTEEDITNHQYQPNVEIIKAVGFYVPTEVPHDNLENIKDHFIDLAATEGVRHIPEGEQDQVTNERIPPAYTEDSNVGLDTEEELNDMETVYINHQNQYGQFDRKSAMLEDSKVSSPKNIYDIMDSPKYNDTFEKRTRKETVLSKPNKTKDLYTEEESEEEIESKLDCNEDSCNSEDADNTSSTEDNKYTSEESYEKEVNKEEPSEEDTASNLECEDGNCDSEDEITVYSNEKYETLITTEVDKIKRKKNEGNKGEIITEIECKGSDCALLEEEVKMSDDEENLKVISLNDRIDSNTKLVLVLPPENVVVSKKTHKKRSTDDSFNVNIGAGYGVGVDQNLNLPNSTTTINSANYITGLLKNEAVIVGRPLQPLPQPEGEMLESRSIPVKTEVKQEEPKKGVMNFKEIQQIIHNVDDNSEYSKIVQVVKVPAVYEIHLEKVAPAKKAVSDNNKKYIHPINNLLNNPKKILSKTKIKPNRSNNYVKIDDWQVERDREQRRWHPNPIRNINPHTNFQGVEYNNFNKPIIRENNGHEIVRQKKTTQLGQNHFPFYQPTIYTNNLYRPQPITFETPRYNLQPTSPKKAVYSTLSHIVPYNLRRRFQDPVQRSEVRDNNFVYGSHKEKVLNPDEINITMQPGTTVVTLPKLESEHERNFVVTDPPVKPCQQGYRQSETKELMEAVESKVDNVYFTTNRPFSKDHKDRSSRVFNKMSTRRHDLVPVKYILYIDRIYHDGW
uniref:Uncharacterized protein LOC114326001 n=1 Tax=Diabrotica virgifera virgifera TaxID=50390 RepID=A0A6P7F915_DIAVI